MEIANQIFFIVFALITIAIALSAIPQFQVQRADMPSIYWPLSTGFYALSALSFGLALWAKLSSLVDPLVTIYQMAAICQSGVADQFCPQYRQAFQAFLPVM